MVRVHATVIEHVRLAKVIIFQKKKRKGYKKKKGITIVTTYIVWKTMASKNVPVTKSIMSSKSKYHLLSVSMASRDGNPLLHSKQFLSCILQASYFRILIIHFLFGCYCLLQVTDKT